MLALDGALATGPHGLPLMGTGDWNDGMDRVGAGGKGREHMAGLVPVRRADRFATIAERRDSSDAAEAARRCVRTPHR